MSNAWDGPTILFLHLPKSGGETLTGLLRRNVGRDRAHIIRSLRREDAKWEVEEVLRTRGETLRLLAGHMPFGAHELVARRSTYITIVRDPIARVVSHYRHVVRHEPHYDHWFVVGNRLSLTEYVESGRAREIDNGQVRDLAGDLDTPFGEADDRLLERAIANLEAQASVVGTTEAFDDAVLLCGRVLNLPSIHYLRRNTGPATDSVELDSRTMATIARFSRLDQELHAYARARMKRELEESFGDAVDVDNERERLRRRNRIYSAGARPAYEWPRALQRAIRRRVR